MVSRGPSEGDLATTILSRNGPLMVPEVFRRAAHRPNQQTAEEGVERRASARQRLEVDPNTTVPRGLDRIVGL